MCLFGMKKKTFANVDNDRNGGSEVHNFLYIKKNRYLGKKKPYALALKS